MIRLTLLFLYVAGVGLYAWKDWYKALCGLILLTAVVEHPDMPKTIMGVQGLNPWNLLLLDIVAAWAFSRRKQNLKWDMPAGTSVLLVLYLIVVVIGVVRMLADPAYLDDSVPSLVSETLVNAVKWTIPGLLLFDGCRSRERFFQAVAAIAGVYFVLAVQVIKWMPLSSIGSGDELTARSLKILVKEVGFHRVNLSAMFAGGSWAVIAARYVGKTRAMRAGFAFMGFAVMFAQALTGGRTGYATWAAVGLLLGLLYWRKLLLMVPAGALLVTLLIPSAKERMLQGFTTDTHDSNERLAEQTAVTVGYHEDAIDEYTITAGRAVIWPYVIEKIEANPLVGYGRLAMRRTGLADRLHEELGEFFPHPHNAYLEWLFDNGVVGFIVVMPFYLLFFTRGVVLFRDPRSTVFTVAGGMAVSLVAALLIASFGSQTFYPREGWVGMWCVFGLLMRVWVERGRLAAARPASARPAIRLSQGRSAVAVPAAAARAIQPASGAFRLRAQQSRGTRPLVEKQPARDARATEAARQNQFDLLLWSA